LAKSKKVLLYRPKVKTFYSTGLRNERDNEDREYIQGILKEGKDQYS
jgi:hypothetical protein